MFRAEQPVPMEEFTVQNRWIKGKNELELTGLSIKSVTV